MEPLHVLRYKRISNQFTYDMAMLCIGNFYGRKMQNFGGKSRTPKSLAVLRMSMRIY